MPIEIGWAATVQWRAGDFSCRILAFFRTFGLFLSSFVLVCISIDRYASMDCIIDTGWHMLLYSIAFHTRFGAILQPMKLDYWKRRGRFMLAIAWACSVICSLPQVGNVGYLIIQFHFLTLLIQTELIKCCSFSAVEKVVEMATDKSTMVQFPDFAIWNHKISLSSSHVCLSQHSQRGSINFYFAKVPWNIQLFLSHIPFKIVSIEMEIKYLK